MDLQEKRTNSTFLLLDCSLREAFSLLCLYIVWTSTAYASGNADISISTAATANGSWSALSGGVYTFTPSANSAVILYTEIQDRLTGNGVTAGNVTIVTACSGAGSQTGDVTHSTVGITAATTSTTKLTFTITAAGSISIAQAITFTPGSNAGTGYPATNIVLTGPSGVNISQPISCIGGATTGVSTTGGIGGNLTCTASGGTVTIGNSVTLTGGTGGSGGGAGAGGAGGAVTLSGGIISITQGINSYGGAGSTSGAGGTGGTISITSNSTTISVAQSINASGGAGATTGAGGDGGPITITAATTVSFTQPVYSTGGNSGTGNGGNGGAISVTSSSGALSIANTINASGGNPGGGVNKNGGTGGAVTISASTTLNISQPVYANGGTPTGSGTATGGAILIVGPGGITLSNLIQTTGSTAGGTITVNDGNTSITSGGVNDGQNGAGYFQAGAVIKIGSGNFKLAHSSNSWTGATTITAGKLTLGSTSTVPDASQLVFNGGRLVMGTYDETVSTIKISAYSVLDMPAGNYTLTASASNGITWTTGKKLGINFWGDVGNNYNGTLAGASDPKLKTGASAELDGTHLAAIYFRRTSNGSTYTATQLASGEIVPTGTLPVKLISFDAKKNKDQVDISWTTASEINSDYFELMRSSDDLNWESIGEVSAAGTSNKLLYYSFIDPSPNAGVNYYQLVEYDFDGTQQKSNVVFISNNDNQTHFLAYPNPTSSNTTFNFYSETGGAYELKAFNIIGEEVSSTKIIGIIGSNNSSLSLHNLSAGIYSFQLFKNDQIISSTKIVKD
jgi:hypothetical protein